MSKMVLGVISDPDMAERAVGRLEELGYNPKDISVVMKDRVQAERFAEDTGGNVAEGAMSGAATGGILGGIAGLLIGVGAIAIPGVGALLIGGPLAAALGLTGAAATTVSGAVTGALAGGLVGALVSLGVPEEDARYYESRIKEGAILIAVPTMDTRVDEVHEVLEDYGVSQIRTVQSDDKRLSKEPRRYMDEESYGSVGMAGGSVDDEDEGDGGGWFEESEGHSKYRKKGSR